jgi:CIC family chloride channel protein
VRELIFSKELYDITFIKNIMVKPPAVIEKNETMEEVLKKFDDYKAWNLPVTDNGKYIGFVSKSKIFTQYRQYLINDAVIPA